MMRSNAVSTVVNPRFGNGNVRYTAWETILKYVQADNAPDAKTNLRILRADAFTPIPGRPENMGAKVFAERHPMISRATQGGPSNLFLEAIKHISPETLKALPLPETTPDPMKVQISLVFAQTVGYMRAQIEKLMAVGQYLEEKGYFPDLEMYKNLLLNPDTSGL